MEVVPEVNGPNVNDNCGGDPDDYCGDFIFSVGDGDGGKAKEGS